MMCVYIQGREKRTFKTKTKEKRQKKKRYMEVIIRSLGDLLKNWDLVIQLLILIKVASDLVNIGLPSGKRWQSFARGTLALVYPAQSAFQMFRMLRTLLSLSLSLSFLYTSPYSSSFHPCLRDFISPFLISLSPPSLVLLSFIPSLSLSLFLSCYYVNPFLP